MRSIRKLYFQNAAGERYGLNGESGVYASMLAGFGFTLSPVFADLSRGFWIPVSDESEPQNSLPFTMTFIRNPYDAYTAWVDWINAAGTLTIVYNPTGKQEYCRDVAINSIQKGELNSVGWLEVPCSYYCITPWYLPSPTAIRLDAAATDESKRYTYSYSQSLHYGADSAAACAATIAGAGHIPGALELTYRGGITKPKIRLVGKSSGKTYGICSVDGVFLSTDTLKFSTKYEDSYVKKVTADGAETDLLDALDLSTTPFFHIPVDEPCDISIESDAAFDGVANLTIFYYYRSV